ncbi:MAG TPA: outer membrane protein assembly factor BamE [Methylophilus sp.]|nr:outer membrane protein assembly factor BamE [Methylophilus sp.]HQQ32527.1 outer membrane protein assembly factor BamE [Methylophilus sp.]
MRYFLVLLISLLTACGAGVPSLKPYKMDIQQGNVVTSKMLLQLRPGMTKSQVRYIMGTPLVVDSFHRDRWDYFYQLRQAGKVVEQRRVILEFEKDLLKRVRGDVVPAGSQPAEGAVESNASKTIEVAPTKREEKSWTDRLKFWKSDDKPAEVPKAPAETPKSPEAPEMKPEIPAAPATAPSSEAPAGDTPSILAVPIESGVTAPVTLPAPQAPKVDTPQSQPAQAEPAKPDPTPAPVAVEPVKPAETEAMKPAPEVMPVAPVRDERLIFRMDKTMRTPVVEPVAPTPEAPVAAPKPAAKKLEPPPEEEGPGYFERILEQIGF